MYYNHRDRWREYDRYEDRCCEPYSGRTKAERNANFQSIDDLLLKQRKGELMTREEKNVLNKYANEQRKKNIAKKQHANKKKK